MPGHNFRISYTISDIWNQELASILGCIQSNWTYDKRLSFEVFSVHSDEKALHLELQVEDSVLNISEIIEFNDKFGMINSQSFYVVTSLCPYGTTVLIHSTNTNNTYVCAQSDMSGMDFECQTQCSVSQYILTRLTFFCFFFVLLCLCVSLSLCLSVCMHAFVYVCVCVL